MIEVQCNALFLSVFGGKLAVKNERKRVSRMWENEHLSMTCFACVTPLSNVSIFWPQKPPPPPWQNRGFAPGLETISYDWSAELLMKIMGMQW